MKKGWKRFIWWNVILLVPLVGILLLLPFLIDVNRFKEPILAKVESFINGDVTLGRISLKLFPYVGLRLEELSVKNLPDSPFADRPVVTLGALDLKVELETILKRKIVASLSLKRPEINFLLTSEGSNVDALMRPSTQPPAGSVPPPTDEPAGPPPAAAEGGAAGLITTIVVSEIVIEEGRLLYEDRTAGGPPVVVDGLRLRVDNVVLTDPSKPIGIDLGLRVFGAGKENVSFKGSVAVDTASKKARIDGGKIGLAGSTIALDASIEGYDSTKQISATVAAPSFALDSVYALMPTVKQSLPPGSRLEGAVGFGLKANGTPESIALNGQVDLKGAAIQHGETFLKPSGATFDLAVDGAYTPGGINVESFALHILSGAVTGTGRLGLTGGQGLSLNLETTPLDLKELISLSPANKGTDVEGALKLTFQASGPLTQPKKLVFAGTLASEKIRYEKYELTRLSSEFSYLSPEATLKSLAFDLWEGRFSGAGVVNLGGEKPAWDLDLQVSGLNMDIALKELAGKPGVLTGKGGADFKLKGEGTTAEDVKKSVSGTGNLKLKDGVFRPVNIAGGVFSKELLGGLQAAGVTPGPVKSLTSEEGTSFGDLASTFTVAQGAITVPSMLLSDRAHEVELDGTVNLDLKLDMKGRYLLSKEKTNGWLTNPKVRSLLVDKKGRFLVPFTMTGDATSPLIAPDVGYVQGLAGKAATALVKEEVEKKVMPKVKKELKGIERKLEKKDLGKELKKLF